MRPRRQGEAILGPFPILPQTYPDSCSLRRYVWGSRQTQTLLTRKESWLRRTCLLTSACCSPRGAVESPGRGVGSCAPRRWAGWRRRLQDGLPSRPGRPSKGTSHCGTFILGPIGRPGAPGARLGLGNQKT